MELDDGWLEIELDAASAEAATWTGGLRQSYDELVAQEAANQN